MRPWGQETHYLTTSILFHFAPLSPPPPITPSLLWHFLHLPQQRPVSPGVQSTGEHPTDKLKSDGHAQGGRLGACCPQLPTPPSSGQGSRSPAPGHCSPGPWPRAAPLPLGVRGPRPGATTESAWRAGAGAALPASSPPQPQLLSPSSPQPCCPPLSGEFPGTFGEEFGAARLRSPRLAERERTSRRRRC